METFTLEKGPRDLTTIVRFLSSLSPTRAWEVVVKRKTKPRSDPQNNALWGVAYKRLSDFTGYEMDELHRMFMKGFFGVKIVQVGDLSEELPIRTTTTDESGERSVMSVEEFSALYDYIQRKAASIGCHIPDPDKNWREAA